MNFPLIQLFQRKILESLILGILYSIGVYLEFGLFLRQLFQYSFIRFERRSRSSLVNRVRFWEAFEGAAGFLAFEDDFRVSVLPRSSRLISAISSSIFFFFNRSDSRASSRILRRSFGIELSFQILNSLFFAL